MKRTLLVFISLLFALLTGCGEGNPPAAADWITIDITATYPEKEFILQDFMDVEYVVLETTDEFITQGVVKAIGNEFLLVTNRVDGDIFIFDRNGKGIRKINRWGQGNEEYQQTTELVLDEDNRELFVSDYYAGTILVYDLYGNFKRSFKFTDSGYYTDLFNYDRDHLLAYKHDELTEREKDPSCHILFSKQDGTVIREIQVPVKEVKTPNILTEEMTVITHFYTTFPYQGNWLLMNPSSDTVYRYLPDGTIRPFIARTPSIQAMDTEIFLFPGTLTERYYFMHTLKKELNAAWKFLVTDLVYDNQEHTIYRYTVCNKDFSSKKTVSMKAKPVHQEIATWQSLDAFMLVEAYGNGELKGRLKDIAAELDEESNPVLMLVKHRN
ncbi:MAG: 6-bladed beta-propeller [Tannerellaceae bacterium]|nr:6-bladed beta-propeller [Tannerellaceae bacterium]